MISDRGVLHLHYSRKQCADRWSVNGQLWFFFSTSVNASCWVAPSQALSVTAELIWHDLIKPKEPRFGPNIVQIKPSSHVWVWNTLTGPPHFKFLCRTAVLRAILKHHNPLKSHHCVCVSVTAMQCNPEGSKDDRARRRRRRQRRISWVNCAAFGSDLQ